MLWIYSWRVILDSPQQEVSTTPEKPSLTCWVSLFFRSILSPQLACHHTKANWWFHWNTSQPPNSLLEVTGKRVSFLWGHGFSLYFLQSICVRWCGLLASTVRETRLRWAWDRLLGKILYLLSKPFLHFSTRRECLRVDFPFFFFRPLHLTWLWSSCDKLLRAQYRTETLELRKSGWKWWRSIRDRNLKAEEE